MKPVLKAGSLVGAIAAMISMPLVYIWAQLTVSAPIEWNAWYFITPILLGLCASGFWFITWNTIRIRKYRGVIAGIATACLTFLLFGAVADYLPLDQNGHWGRNSFVGVATVGFLLLGWIPILFGGFAGWFAERKYLKSSYPLMQPANSNPSAAD